MKNEIILFKDQTIKLEVNLKDETVWLNARQMAKLFDRDYKTIRKEIDGEMRDVYVPGIKIGDGQTYVQDLPFVDTELRDRIMEHINNENVHVILQEKLFWNNKLNVNDNMELVDGALVLNRN